MWLNSESPVVAVSLRFDRIDAFWFTLAHELGHIYHGHATGIDSDLTSDKADAEAGLPHEELVANAFACNLLVPKQEIDSFVARIRPLYSRSRINQFANRIRVHPGIIVGQLQKRGEIKFSQGRDMLAKVRELVTQSAVTDGWGHYPTASL
jgi:HTH-type transcriptional regulator/antitoxin HigA